MSYLERIATCRRWNPDDYRPLMIEDISVGRVGHDFARRLADFPHVFQVSDRAITLSDDLGDPEARTTAVREVLLDLRAQGEVPNWRDEDYPVVRRWGDEPFMTVERAAVPLFGMRGFGVHLNGYVETGDGLRLWVARRAKDKATAPGKLDHLVAGGQPHGLSVAANLVKECAEEAGMNAALARRAVPVGAVSYICERDEGLRDDVLFDFDLAVPADFTPRNTDGEVESSELWPMAKVLETIRETEDFKFNVNLVILDFAIRHGLLRPDDPDYQAIWEGLRRPEDV